MKKKLAECPDWKKVIFSDRAILRKDLELFSKWQIEALMEVIVEPTKERGVYRVHHCPMD